MTTGSSGGYRIGELARATGTKVDLIRWYEREGLLPAPPRSPGNYRLYDERCLRRLTFIRRARALGFPLGQVRALLALADDRLADCAAVDTLARGHLVEVDRKLADLAALRAELAALLASCEGGTVARCRVLEAFAAGAPATGTPPDTPGRSRTASPFPACRA